jgi:mannitol/fructose-specific phosphotransferase system IIA component (Ntr-type)
VELKDVLDPRCVVAQSAATSKDEVLDAIGRLAVESSVLKDISAEEVRNRLAERESQGSTGFESSVAIPHCSMDDIQTFVVGVLSTAEPVDFEAMDGRPSQLFFFIIGPRSQRSRHVGLLSAISKVVRAKERIEALISANSAEQLYEETLRSIAFRAEATPAGPASMVQLFCRREELFEDILQVFSETTQSSIFVDDIQDAGAYLHELPLFSALWTNSADTPVKHIRAIVKKSQTNDLIRKISLIEDGIFQTPGVLLSVQELQYTTGSIEI